MIATTDPDGSPTFIDTRVGEGFYVDEDGQRRAVDVVGFDGQPGDVVRMRRPLLPSWFVPAPHRHVHAVGLLLLGLLGMVPAVVLYRLRDD